MKKIPSLSEKPKRDWWYNKRYFNVGEKITYVDLHDIRKTTKVKKIKVNSFGRVSYDGEDGSLIFTEDIIKVISGARVVGLKKGDDK